jgi:predicted CXXCH cytochrome family protein
MKPSLRCQLTLVLMGIMALSGHAFAKATCFQCHKEADFSKKTVHRPVAEGQCGLCHNPHVARFEGLLQQSGADLCYKCHQDEAAAFRKGITHQPVRQGACLTCHDPHASEAKALTKGRLSDNCFACHKDLPAKYKYTHSPYAKGDCPACHRPHSAQNPQMLNSKPETLCISCHKGDSLRQAHRGFPQEPTGCLTCHSPHGSGSKALIRDVLHSPFKKGCSECHSQGRMGAENCLRCHEKIRGQVGAIHSHLMDNPINSCTTCHTPHAGDEKNLLKGSQSYICRSCHEDTFQRYQDRLYIHSGALDCKSCHAVHGSDNLAMLREGGNDSCSRCHETQGKFSHPVGEKILDHRTGQMVTCVSCHNPMGTDYKYDLKLSGEKDLCVECHRSY